jgi:hypothetical protein
MMFRAHHPLGARGHATPQEPELPRPTMQFRLRAWRTFQKALDPLGPPKPIRRLRLR